MVNQIRDFGPITYTHLAILCQHHSMNLRKIKLNFKNKRVISYIALHMYVHITHSLWNNSSIWITRADAEVNCEINDIYIPSEQQSSSTVTNYETLLRFDFFNART